MSDRREVAAYAVDLIELLIKGRLLGIETSAILEIVASCPVLDWSDEDIARYGEEVIRQFRRTILP